MLYTSLIYLHKTFIFETRSVCAYTARTQSFSNSHTSLEFILSSSRTECENVALGGVDTSFFLLFFTKKCTFLYFFTAFCTFLLNNDFFCGAATVGSALKTLFNCFLVVFMLKYQGGHGVWPFLKDFALKSVVVLLPLDHYQSNFYFLLAHRRILMLFSVL